MTLCSAVYELEIEYFGNSPTEAEKVKNRRLFRPYEPDFLDEFNAVPNHIYRRRRADNGDFEYWREISNNPNISLAANRRIFRLANMEEGGRVMFK